MKLEGITEQDLNGILFVEYPSDMTLDESRESLELLIADCYDEMCSDWDADIRPEMCISPFWTMMALLRKRGRDLKGMDEGMRKAELEWAWKSREKRLKAKGWKLCSGG